jgi:hypothetical protein
MIVASSMSLLASSRQGERSGALPWVLLMIGSAASLSASSAVQGCGSGESGRGTRPLAAALARSRAAVIFSRFKAGVDRTSARGR